MIIFDIILSLCTLSWSISNFSIFFKAAGIDFVVTILILMMNSDQKSWLKGNSIILSNEIWPWFIRLWNLSWLRHQSVWLCHLQKIPSREQWKNIVSLFFGPTLLRWQYHMTNSMWPTTYFLDGQPALWRWLTIE